MGLGDPIAGQRLGARQDHDRGGIDFIRPEDAVKSLPLEIGVIWKLGRNHDDAFFWQGRQRVSFARPKYSDLPLWQR